MSRRPINGEGQATWERELLPGDAFTAPKPEAFDALADLFLGGEQHEGRSTAGSLTVSRAAPTLRLVPDISQGKPASPAPESTGRAQSRQSVRIEGLILGHLPVLAAAWVMQYAR